MTASCCRRNSLVNYRPRSLRVRARPPLDPLHATPNPAASSSECTVSMTECLCVRPGPYQRTTLAPCAVNSNLLVERRQSTLTRPLFPPRIHRVCTWRCHRQPSEVAAAATTTTRIHRRSNTPCRWIASICMRTIHTKTRLRAACSLISHRRA